MAVNMLKLAGGGEVMCQMPDRSASGEPCLTDWLASQRAVMGIWLDRLIAEGDPHDMISLVHRQAAWLDMMRQRVNGITA